MPERISGPEVLLELGDRLVDLIAALGIALGALGARFVGAKRAPALCSVSVEKDARPPPRAASRRPPSRERMRYAVELELRLPVLLVQSPRGSDDLLDLEEVGCSAACFLRSDSCFCSAFPRAERDFLGGVLEDRTRLVFDDLSCSRRPPGPSARRRRGFRRGAQVLGR
jgi:hypothetical protein